MFSPTGARIDAVDEGGIPLWCARRIPYFVAASTFLLSGEYTAEIKYSVYL